MTLAPLVLCSLLLAAQDPPSVGELARRIASDKDATNPEVFVQLADHGDASALSALERGLRSLKDPETRGHAYEAIARFAGKPGLAPDAGRVLENEVRKAKHEDSRLAAARAILAFDPVELARGWSERHKDDAVRQLFADALVVTRAESGDPDAVRAIFETTSTSLEAGVRYLGIDRGRAERLSEVPHREVVRDALGALRDDPSRAVLAEVLAQPRAGRVWKLMLLRILESEPGPAVDAAIGAACGDRDPTVALLAVDFLVQRVDHPDRAAALEPLLRSKEPSLRRAALASLGVVQKTDAGFRARLLEYARSNDEAIRMGAAAALAEVRTTEAKAALVAMIPDESWSVRVEVLHALMKARPKEAIPVLIERMRVETGRFDRDVHAALVGITAIDLGRRHEAWTHWWEREKDAFVVPGAAAAQRALNERKRDPRDGGTVAVTEDFYEIEVESERVVFVLDTSGSMRLEVTTVGTVKKTRMEVAKDQLSQVIRSMPDGTLFNVIFFEETVKALSRKTMEMNKSNRQKAMRFVRDQYGIGSTALYPALQLAFDDPLVDTIYLLSDGAPTVGEITDIEEIRAEVARWNSARHVRIHGISMGQDSTLLRWLCEDTGGEYRRVD